MKTNITNITLKFYLDYLSQHPEIPHTFFLMEMSEIYYKERFKKQLNTIPRNNSQTTHNAPENPLEPPKTSPAKDLLDWLQLRIYRQYGKPKKTLRRP